MSARLYEALQASSAALGVLEALMEQDSVPTPDSYTSAEEGLTFPTLAQLQTPGAEPAPDAVLAYLFNAGWVQ